MEFCIDLKHKPGNLKPSACIVEAVVELPTKEFDGLLVAPCMSRGFIAKNSEKMWSTGSENHCVLVLGVGRQDGVLIESEGYDYVRYGAYVTGARTLLEAELEQAVTFIVEEILENEPEGNRCLPLDVLREKTGLALSEDNGIGPMLLAALAQRPEVTDAVLVGSHISAAFYHDFYKPPSEREVSPDERQHQQSL